MQFGSIQSLCCVHFCCCCSFSCFAFSLSCWALLCSEIVSSTENVLQIFLCVRSNAVRNEYMTNWINSLRIRSKPFSAHRKCYTKSSLPNRFAMWMNAGGSEVGSGAAAIGNEIPWWNNQKLSSISSLTRALHLSLHNSQMTADIQNDSHKLIRPHHVHITKA